MVFHEIASPGIIEQLLAFVFFVKVVYVLAIGTIGFLVVRKVMRAISKNIATEVGLIAFVLLSAFAWIFILATLAVTAITVIVFFFFGSTLVGGIGVLALILKD